MEIIIIYISDVSDFIKFITSNTFVNKSLFIIEFIVYDKQTNLITHLHWFGKFTNLSVFHIFLVSALQ